MKEKEINAIRTCHSTDAEQMLENIDDDRTKVMDKYIKNRIIENIYYINSCMLYSSYRNKFLNLAKGKWAAYIIKDRLCSYQHIISKLEEYGCNRVIIPQLLNETIYRKNVSKVNKKFKS